MSISSKGFEVLASFLKTESGLVLPPQKTYLAESRLVPIVTKFGLTSLDDLALRLRRREDPTLMQAVVEAMTISETSFFRDSAPFSILRETVLPRLLEARPEMCGLRIWSAATSGGQEAYSIAMCVREMAASVGNRPIEIVGTDISEQALSRARGGHYSAAEIDRGLPEQLVSKYMTRTETGWAVNEDLRKMVTFRHQNLLSGFTLQGHFDVIFCRNVLIYFDAETKAEVLNRIASQMRDDGTLFLGAAETVVGITEAFRPIAGLRGACEKRPQAIQAVA